MVYGRFVKDYGLEISKGNVQGHTVVHKFGEGEDIASGTGKNDFIWDRIGQWTPPTQNRVHNIASTSVEDAGTLISTGTVTGYTNSTGVFTDSSATFVTDAVAVGDVMLNDTSQDHSIVLSVDSETQLTLEPFHHFESDSDYTGDTYRIARSAGTGVAVNHIKFGSQKDGTKLSEFVIMNGTTNVATTNSYYRITRMHGHGSGSNKKAVGDITATAVTDATVTAQISAGYGSTQMAIYHVRRGTKAYMTSWHATLHRNGVASDAMAELTLNSQLWWENSDGENLRDSMGISVNGGKAVQVLDPPMEFEQDTDIYIKCISASDSASIIAAGFTIIEVEQ